MKWKAWLCALLAALPLAHTALAGVDTPPAGKLVPGGHNNVQYMYVFGPSGNARSGAQDGIQLVFFEVPTGAGPVSIYVYDPASRNRLERRSGWGSATTTRFTVYGGKGAYSDPASQAVRPTADQPGKVLDTRTFRLENEGEWVAFGPYDASQGEVIGDKAYFKLAAVGEKGGAANFFRLAVTPTAAEAFTHELTLHFADQSGATMRFEVAVPAGAKTIYEHNYDFDTGGRPYFNDSGALDRSRTAHWVNNELTIDPKHAGRRVTYHIEKGSQSYANGGFYFTDADGKALRTYFDASMAPAPMPVGNTCTIDTRLVQMTKAIPAMGYLNEELTMTVDVTAKADVSDVVVTSTVPAGTSLVSSTPPGQQAGNVLTWTFAALDAGEAKHIDIVLRPEKEGELTSCGTVVAQPRCCTETVVGRPQLAIEKTGPAQAMLGDQVTYHVTVKNVGTAVARNVVLVDSVPDGLSHASGSRRLTQAIGDLAPQQARELPIVLKADARGRVCNRASAKADNAGAVEDDACTVIVQQLLEVAKTGTKQQFIGKTATYEIVVSNPGDTALTNVMVSDDAPAGTRIVAAPGATVAGNRAVWQLPQLNAGAKKTLELTLTSATAGKLCNSVAVASAEGLTATSQACTVWRGHPALLLEVIDTVDPLLPGEETTYVIRVTNQGTAEDTQVKVLANFPAEISPVSATGDTATSVKGKQVTVTPYPVLRPKQAIQWTVRAKADQAGDSRLKVELSSTLLKTPVHEEESTQVY